MPDSWCKERKAQLWDILVALGDSNDDNLGCKILMYVRLVGESDCPYGLVFCDLKNSKLSYSLWIFFDKL